MKRLSKYKNQILSITFALVIVIGAVCSTSFTSSAWGTYNIGINQPSVTEDSGYVEILYEDRNTGSRFVEVYMWVMASADNNEGKTTVDVVCSSNYCELQFGFVSTGSWACLRFATNGTSMVYSSSGNASSSSNWNCSIGYPQNGWQIVGVQLYGSYGFINYYQSFEQFNVIYGQTQTSSYYLFLQVLNELQNLNSSVNGKLDNIISEFVTLLNSTNEKGQKLDNIYKYLYQTIYPAIDEVEAELKKQTTWLEKIWNSIQEFFNPSDEDKETTDKFKEDSDKQSSELNELNQQNKTDKVDVGSASGSVDANIDENAIQNYGTVLSVFTNHEYILKSILVVLAIGLVAYVLFGKK